MFGLSQKNLYKFMAFLCLAMMFLIYGALWYNGNVHSAYEDFVRYFNATGYANEIIGYGLIAHVAAFLGPLCWLVFFAMLWQDNKSL